MESLLSWDRALLRIFNVDLSHPVLDQFWLTVTHLERQPLVMFLLLPALIIWAFSLYKQVFLKVLLLTALAVGLSDAFSYRVVKALVARPRPTQDVAIATWLRPVGDAHGPSFPSNHAANCFAGATVLTGFFRRRRYMFYIFAAVVSLSRVALGVHYPSDVVCGALLGFGIGWAVRRWLEPPFMKWHFQIKT